MGIKIRVLAILLLLVFFVALISGLNIKFGEDRAGVTDYYLSFGEQETGAKNLVAAIYLNYRLYDTLGEAVVLYVAVLGIWKLLKTNASSGKKEEHNNASSSTTKLKNS